MTSTPSCNGSQRRYCLVLLQILFVVVVFCASAFGVPVIANTTTGTASLTGAAGAASYNFTHTSSGTFPYMLVTVAMNISNSTGATVSSLTYKGTPLTLVKAQNDSSPLRRVEIWKLANPPAGTWSVVVNVALTTGTTVGVVTEAITLNGVDTTTPLGTATSAGSVGNSSPASTTVVSAANDLVLDTVAVAFGTTITANTGTQFFTATSGAVATSTRGAGSSAPGAASVTMSEALSVNGRWAIAAVPVKPAATIADLVPTATPFSPSLPVIGVTTTTTFTITNNGPLAATGATLTIPLPASLTLISATPSSGSCSGTTTVTCTGFSSIPNGGTATVVLSVTPNAGGAFSVTGTATDTVEFDPPANSSVTVSAAGIRICATPGKDGAGGTLTGVINSYFAGSASAAAGATSISVAAGVGKNTDINAGDLLIVMQMQDADINSSNDERYGAGTGTVGGTTGAGAGYTALNSSGLYEYVIATNTVTFAAGGTLTINGVGTGAGLLNSYNNAAPTGTKGASRFQVIRVPQYSTATFSSTLTATAWNGAVGGVLAVDVAGVLTLGGTVSVDGLGFRGGAGRVLNGGGTGASTDYVKLSSVNANGSKGEGIAGTPRYVYSAGAALNTGVEGLPVGSHARGAPANAGGGATDADQPNNDENSGGGGGGNGGGGGKGGNSWNTNIADGGSGGVAIPSSQTLLVMGGGGGSGDTNNGTSDPNTNTTGINSSGMAGGGIVLIRADEVQGTGVISANGLDALNVAQDGGGGGGAGGTVLVAARFGNLLGLTVNANGGKGGNAWGASAPGTCPNGAACNHHGPGGGGGGGVVLLSFAAGTVNFNGGLNGTTTTDLNAYGATAGAAGVTATTVTFAAFPGADSGAECAPDLNITNVGTGPYVRGLSFSYTLGINNLGTQSTSGVVTVTDTLPAGLVPTTASGTGWQCSVAGQTIACNRSDVLAGLASYPSITLSGTVGQTAPDAVSNTATTSGGSEFYLTNDTATDNTTASSVADLSVASVDSPDPVAANGNITYTQSVSNAGPSDAVNAAFVTTVPANTGFQSIVVPSGWNCSVPPIGSAGTITCVTADLAVGTNAIFTMVTKVNAGVVSGVLTNMVSASSLASDPNGANNTAITLTTVGASAADVTVTNSASPTAVAAGGNIVFTHVVTNQGGSAATTVTYSEPVLTNVTFQSLVSPGGWACTPPAVNGTGTISCNIASLAAGASATFTTTVKVNGGTAQGTIITDTATVGAANDSLATNNSGSATAVVTLGTQSDLALTNVASTPQVYAGDNVSFVQTIVNNGPSAASTVSISETVPTNTTFQSMTPPPGWTCTAPVAGAFTCSTSTLANGASASFLLSLTVNSGTANNTVITDSISATNSNGDPLSSNNTNIQGSTTTITGTNLVVTNTLAGGSPDPVTATATYTLNQTVTNAGPSDSGAITVVETIPANTTVGVITKPAGWACGAQVGNTITCTGPNLAAGAAALNFAIPLTVNAGTAGGTLLAETISATPATGEKIPADNSATYTNSVAAAGQFDLEVTAAGTPEPVIAGQNLTYNATVNNKGPSAVTNPSFTLPLPTNTTFVSLTAPGGATCNPPAIGQGTPYTITCSFTGSYPAGLGPQAVQMVVKVLASTASGSAISETMSATPTLNDSNTPNNTVTVSTQVITEADLSITNSDSPDPLNTTSSNTITYTQVVTNNGPSDAQSLVVTETIPAGTGTLNVLVKPAGWACTALAGLQFTCSGPSLAAGASGNIIFSVVNTNPSGQLTETASVISNTLELNAANNSANAVTTLATSTQSDLQTVVTAGSGTVAAGSNVSFTSVVTNRGPATAANISVTIPVPPNTTFQSLPTPGGWSCLPALSIGSTGTVTCTIASLAANTAGTFVLTVQANGSTSPGTIIGETTTASLAIPANDPDHTNDASTGSTRVTNPSSADVSVTLTSSAASVKAGNPFTLTAVVANAGPATATGVTLTIPIPSSEQFVSFTTTQGTCSYAGGFVTCILNSIPNAGSATVNLVLNATGIGNTSNTASVISNESDPNNANNSSTAAMLITSPTTIKLASFTASSNGEKTVIEWRTREEVRNLGYNVYREVNGERLKLNGSLIAGSAVRAHTEVVQHSASSYSWTDDQPVTSANYWIEDVSINGARTWNGPATAQRMAIKSASRSATFADISSSMHSVAVVPFNPLPAADVVTTLNSTPGWIDNSSNPSRPNRVRVPTKLDSTYLAGTPAVKIGVDHEGWYRVTQAQLVSAGYDTRVSPSSLHLYAEGNEIPMLVTTDANGTSIEFYGTGLDTPSTATRVYWLTTMPGLGRRIPTVTADGSVPTTNSYLATIEKRDRSFYFAALTTNGDEDNFFGDVIAGTAVDEHLTVSNLDAQGSSTVKLVVSLQGITDPADHDVQVSVNGVSVGDVIFSGMVRGPLALDIPANLIHEGDNVVTLNPTGGDSDVSAVDRISITYPRLYAAAANQLDFIIPAQTEVKLIGFAAPLHVFQIESAQMITVPSTHEQDGTYSATLVNPWAGPRTYYAFSDGAVQQPSTTQNVPSQLFLKQNAADLLIVSHHDFISSLTPLVALRQQQGFNTSVVDIEDVYDEFNYGEKDPSALRLFLTTATSSWSTAPKWLLLVGDASVDPRNFLGLGSFDFVPTKLIATAELKTSSDGWFSEFAEDGQPHIATGRLPVRTAAEASAMVSKIVAYDSQPLGTWNNQVLLVNDQDLGADFSGESAKIAALVPATLQASTVDFGSADAVTVRNQLLAQLNSGQLIVNYLGHGSVDVWSGSEILNSTDSQSLTNGGQLPFVIAMDCLNGFFHDVYQVSLAKSLMLATSGGAAAVWASSGLTEPEPQFVMDESLMQYLFANPSATIGEATTQSKSGVSDVDVRRTWNLFGDPTMKLRSGGNLSIWRPTRPSLNAVSH